MQLARAFFIMLLLAGTTNVAVAQQQAEPSPTPRYPMDECGELMFRVLPGIYNFCLAKKQWDKGDRAQAIELMRLAAGWGNKPAQSALGVAYFNGQGVAQDRALGLAWLQLAAERQQPSPGGLLASALSQANVAEKSKAQQLYRQLRSRYADEVAALRADRRYRRVIFEIRSNPAYRSGKCFEGVNASLEDVNESRSAQPEFMPESCSLASEQVVIARLGDYSDRLFDGWKGRAVVGPFEVLK